MQGLVHPLGGGLMAMLVLLGAAGCHGTMLLRDPTLPRCETSAECGLRSICVDGLCTPSDTPCSLEQPAGYCPREMRCADGVCTRDHGRTTWCNCEPTTPCVDGICGDSDTATACGRDTPFGSCTGRAVCVGGICVALDDAKNSCSPERPEGLCPMGAACRDGFCMPIAEHPCSVDLPDGACPAGQACDGTGCVDVHCSDAAPFGRCPVGFVCVEGTCEDDIVLQTCDSLDCNALNRVGCDDSGDRPRCTDCKPGYHESLSLACLPDLCVDVGCEAFHRECIDGGGFAECGNCVDGFHEANEACVIDTCGHLGCGSENRSCRQLDSKPAVCAACLGGFIEGPGGECVLPTCEDLECEEFGRSCEEEEDGTSICGECLDGFHEVVQGRCVACVSTAECPAGHYCDPAVGCRQDCLPVSGAEVRCANGDVCSPYGRCVPDTATGDICAAGTLAVGDARPIVALVIDRSGSMRSEIEVGGPSRWRAVEDVLFQLPGDTSDSGVVRELEHLVKFTMALYDNPFHYDDSTPAPTCPSVDWPTIREPQTDNHDALLSTFSDSSPDGHTPTSEALNAVIDSLLELRDPSPKYILLATDGMPQLCSRVTPKAGFARTVLAAERAWTSTNEYTDRIETFILFIGELTDEDGRSSDAAAHIQDVANAGQGCPVSPEYADADTCNPTQWGTACYDMQTETDIVACPAGPDGQPGNHPYYVADDQRELASAFADILDEVFSCRIELDNLGLPPLGGTVLFDGDAIPRGAWSFEGTSSIRLDDAYCAKLRDGDPHFVSVLVDRCDYDG